MAADSGRPRILRDHQQEDLTLITNFLLDHRWLVSVVAVVGMVIFLLIGWFVVSKPVMGKRISLAIAVASVLGIAGLTLTPTGRQAERTCTVQFDWPSLTQVDTTANLLLFIPLALFVSLWTARPWLTLAGCVALSVVIEAVQALVTPLGRACDTADLTNNAVGALVGAGIAALLLHRYSNEG